MQTREKPAWPIPLLLYALALVAGAVLSQNMPRGGEGEEAAGKLYILGPARSLLSNGLYERADVYFHKGAEHTKKEAFHGFFQKWKDAICPKKHVHARGREVEEILPWLRLATQSDPHNVEVFLVAAYWLNGECRRTDLAIDAIREAIEKNPDRYELQLEMGRLYLHTDEIARSLSSMEKALSILESAQQPDPEQAAIDLSFILSTRSYLYEALGDREKAIESTREVLALRPTPALSERLDKLQSSPLDPEAAKARLRKLFHKTHSCGRDEHEDHDHGDGEHED